ncbi:hypothetical protein B0H14DRAFT_2767663 [Mycena olivaceomarginata]|nr:hypothetical protein B0H14DRAFT_2884910 [Mycena olivaceomarginata]KAJ7848657.1 hypothetical protein B0H14DRAFT_2767663 [Mycena olivaceomarginata]
MEADGYSSWSEHRDVWMVAPTSDKSSIEVHDIQLPKATSYVRSPAHGEQAGVSASGLQWGDYYACKPKKNLERCPGAVASAAPTSPHRVPGISDGIFAGAGAGTDVGGGGAVRVCTHAYGGDGSTLLFHSIFLHHHTSHSTRILPYSSPHAVGEC